MVATANQDNAKTGEEMKLLTIEDVMKLNIGKRTTLWKKVRDGKFPKPIKLGDASSSPIRWYESDIQDYIRNLGNDENKVHKKNK